MVSYYQGFLFNITLQNFVFIVISVYHCINPFKYPTVNCPSQETEVTSTPTRPVDNVVITTNGLQDRNIHILDGTTVENKGKLILPFYC